MKILRGLLCGFVLLGWGVLSDAHADDVFVLNFETGLGSQSVQQVRTVQAWSKAVEEASNGRIKINLYPRVRRPMSAATSTGPAPPRLAAVVTGIVKACF